MKIKNLLLSLIILLNAVSFSANAKESSRLAKIKITSEEKTDNREDLQMIDFKKLFDQAENYYKLAKAWNILKCQPKSGFICTKHECKRKDSTAHVILDKKNKTVSRCENENCEKFEAEFEQTGSFINIQSKGPIGSLIRILGDSRYKEITTVGLDAYIANGECLVINE